MDQQRYQHKWLIMAAVSLGMFLTLMDATIVNIAVPAIIKDLNTTVSKVSWVLNAYNLTLAVLFLSMGRIADKFGQKRVFIGGVVVFTLFSLACGLSPGIYWLIVFRVGQAVGGAAMAPVSLAILLGSFPRKQHGLAVGLWGAMGAVAAAIGPTIGGLLVTYVSWHWIFYVNVPVGAVALFFGLAVIPERRRAAAATGVDIVGILIASVGLFCLSLGLIQGNSWGWSSVRIIALLVIAAVTYPMFYWWETHVRSPMFDFKLLRVRSFTAANTAILGLGTAMGGALLLLVIFMVDVLGYSELRAALAITAMPAVALVLSPISGRLVDRIGPRIPAALGVGFFAVGLILLAQLGGDARLIDIIWRIAFLGLGIGFAMPTLAAAAMGSVPDDSGGVGSGAFSMMRQMGFVLGVAILVSIFSHTVAANVKVATQDSISYVNAQPQIPAAAKSQIVAALQKAAAAASQGGPGAAEINNPLADAPPPANAQAAAAQQALAQHIGTLYRTKLSKSFEWPFYAAALAALLAIIPAVMTGRRLGGDRAAPSAQQ